MKNEEESVYLNVLLDQVFDILFVKQRGVNDAEVIFVKILELLEENERLKCWFLHCVRECALSDEIDATAFTERPPNFIDPDLVLFMAHATRWKEFFSIAQERKASLFTIKRFNREIDYSELLLSSLSDDWDDADFYRFFNR